MIDPGTSKVSGSLPCLVLFSAPLCPTRMVSGVGPDYEFERGLGLGMLRLGLPCGRMLTLVLVVSPLEVEQNSPCCWFWVPWDADPSWRFTTLASLS